MTKDWQNKFYTELGRRLAGYRQQKGLTQYGLSRVVGVQLNTISRIENGKGFGFFHVVWITEALGISIDSLLLDMARITRAELRISTQEQKNIISQRRYIHGSIEKEIEDLI